MESTIKPHLNRDVYERMNVVVRDLLDHNYMSYDDIEKLMDILVDIATWHERLRDYSDVLPVLHELYYTDPLDDRLMARIENDASPRLDQLIRRVRSRIRDSLKRDSPVIDHIVSLFNLRLFDMEELDGESNIIEAAIHNVTTLLDERMINQRSIAHAAQKIKEIKNLGKDPDIRYIKKLFHEYRLSLVRDVRERSGGPRGNRRIGLQQPYPGLITPFRSRQEPPRVNMEEYLVDYEDEGGRYRLPKRSKSPEKYQVPREA